MAKGNGPQNPGAPQGAVGEHQCKSEDCKKKPDRAGFCNEHFAWFKWGLVTASGSKARDFDKKFQGYMLSKKPA